MGLFGKKKEKPVSQPNDLVSQVLGALNFAEEYGEEAIVELTGPLKQKIATLVTPEMAELNQLVPMLRVYKRLYPEIPEKYPRFMEKFDRLYAAYNAAAIDKAIDKYYSLVCPRSMDPAKKTLVDAILDKMEELFEGMIQWDGAPAQPAQAQSKPEPETAALPASAVRCPWQDDEENKKWITAIKSTWFVELTAYTVSDEDARALEAKFPLDKNAVDEQGQYVIAKSANSIFYHEYGAWTDFGYTKFIYEGKLYYINVSPTVKLTQALYDRMGDMDHMAKIFVCVMGSLGTNRGNVVITLDGKLGQ